MATLLAPQDNINMQQAQWQEMFNGLFANGVMLGQLSTYTTTTTSGLTISVASGKAMIQGFLARSDAAVPLTCAAADPTNPRIDRAVLHADLTAHTLTVQLLTGTPAPSPSPPALTQTSTVWEISLYQVRVNALQTTLTGGSLTDERIYSGYLPLTGGTLIGALALLSTLSQVGGQATAGTFGVLPVIFQSLRTNVTDTLLHTLLNVTLPANGVYRLSAALEIGNGTTNNKPALQYSMTDARGFADGSKWLADTPTGPQGLDGTHAIYPVTFGTVDVCAQMIQANAGNLTITYQTTGTPNDYVSVMVERVS